MSTKQPDVLVAPPSDLVAISLGEMHQLKWRLVARCDKCSTALNASLPMLIRVYGPDRIWWGARPPCPGLGCSGGRLTYSAQSISGGSWKVMGGPPSELAMNRFKNARGEFYQGPR